MRTVGALLAFAALASQAAPPIEVKGLRPGMTLAATRAAYPGIRCEGATEKDLAWCSYDSGVAEILRQQVEQLDTIAGQPVLHWGIQFAPGDLLGRITVTMAPAFFDSVEVSLKEKFGKPARAKVVTLQNAFGAKFQGRELTWTQGDDFLVVKEFDGSRDTMTLSLGRVALLKKINAHGDTAAKKKASDL